MGDCSCQNCENYTKKAPPAPKEKPNTKQKRRRVQVRPEPLLIKKSDQRPTIKTYDLNNCPGGESPHLAPRTFVQGTAIPRPLTRISEAGLTPPILLALQKLRYRFTLPMESFAWPAIFGGSNLFMVGTTKVAKTFTYMTAIGSLADPDVGDHESLNRFRGPLCVILCPTSQFCEELHDQFLELLHDVRGKPRIANVCYPLEHVDDNIDILITIPNTFMKSLHSNIFKLDRLCYIVLEDTDYLLETDNDTIPQIFGAVNKMLQGRNHFKGVQVISASQTWTPQVEELFQSLHSTPLVCISDHVEAALYGHVEFDVKFRHVDCKLDALKDIFASQDYLYRRTIVICEDDEIDCVNDWMIEMGILTICVFNETSREEIEICEALWESSVKGDYGVLVCTDFAFETLLTINDASWLIHFSVPTTWLHFSRRFLSLALRIQSPLKDEKDRCQIKCRCSIFVDDLCEERMPRIIAFFKRLGRSCFFGDYYHRFCRKYLIEHEYEKIDIEAPLCERALLYGLCYKSFLECSWRHFYTHADFVQRLGNGKLRFRILAMRDTNRFVIQALEHLSLRGDFTKIDDIDLRLPIRYDFGQAPVRASRIRAGKFYAVQDGNSWNLCEALWVTNTVGVRMLADGNVREVDRRTLVETPMSLTIFEMRLSNYIPPFNDHFFSSRSYHLAESSLAKMNYTAGTFTGDIQLQVGDYLFMTNITQTTKVGNKDIVTFSLTSYLEKRLKVIRYSSKPLELLLERSYIYGVDQALPGAYESRGQVDPLGGVLRASLDNDVQEVILCSAISPDEFYVRLAKNNDVLLALEDDIQEVVNSGLLPEVAAPYEGAFRLALDPIDAKYHRVQILQVELDKALCFFVDYGNESIVPIDELKPIPEKFLARLPLQAIQCSLYGLLSLTPLWPETATDVLYEVMFEPGTDIFRALFAKVFKMEQCNSIRGMYRFSIVLKDGFDSKVSSVNEMLVERGLAVLTREWPEDFEIPLQRSSAGQRSKELSNAQSSRQEYIGLCNWAEMEAEVNGEKDFLVMYCPVIPDSTAEDSQNQDKPGPNRYRNNMSVVDWTQTATMIKISLQLTDIKEYRVNIVKGTIFRFWTTINGFEYDLKFNLYKPVEMVLHKAQPTEVQVLLKKRMRGKWPRCSRELVRNLYYKLPPLNEERKQKEDRRKYEIVDFSETDSNEEDIDVEYNSESE